MELQGSIYKLNNTETFASGFQKKDNNPAYTRTLPPIHSY